MAETSWGFVRKPLLPMHLVRSGLIYRQMPADDVIGQGGGWWCGAQSTGEEKSLSCPATFR